MNMCQSAKTTGIVRTGFLKKTKLFVKAYTCSSTQGG